jgi:hypothetical protein
MITLTYTLTQSFITLAANRSYQKRRETQFLVLHETVSQATAARQIAYFNGGDRGANAHGFIDWTGVIQTLPFDEVGWHVGPKANGFTEGYELCHAGNAADFAAEWAIATQFFADRCRAYGFGAERILSHHEITKRYGGTDHTDPDDYFATYGKTVDDFRHDVAKLLANQTNGDDDMTNDERQLLQDLAALRPQPMPDWFAPVAAKLSKLGAQWSGTKSPVVYEALAIVDRAGVFDDALKARAGKAVK